MSDEGFVDGWLRVIREQGEERRVERDRMIEEAGAVEFAATARAFLVGAIAGVRQEYRRKFTPAECLAAIRVAVALEVVEVDDGELALRNPNCEDCHREDAELCPKSERACGHHCNHSWSHDACCYCNTEWGEGGAVVSSELG